MWPIALISKHFLKTFENIHTMGRCLVWYPIVFPQNSRLLKCKLTATTFNILSFRSTFLRVFKFLQIKEWGSNFSGEPILQNVWIIWSPFLSFNFKSFKYRISSSFIKFQCILHDSGVLFSESSNFYKLKRGDLISGGTNFAESLFGPPFLLHFNFKSFKYQISLSFIRFQCILHDSGVLFSEF